MRLEVPKGEWQAKPGEELRIPFLVDPPAAARSSSYSCSCPDERFVRDACQVDLDGEAQPVLLVRVPEGPQLPAGRYDLTLVAVGEGRPASDSFVLEIEGRRCVALPTAPRFSLQPDGSVRVELTLFSCGNVDVSGSLDFRHQAGWRFEIDDPRFDLKLDAGQLDLDLKLRPPAGETVGSGEISVEVSDASGHSLWKRSYPTRASAAPVESADRPAAPRAQPRRWPWLLAIVGAAGAAVFATILILDRRPPPDPGPRRPEIARPGEAELAVFEADPSGCRVHVNWEVHGPPRAVVELLRDGHPRGEFGPGPGEFEDRDVGPGGYSFVYELLVDGAPVGERRVRGNCERRRLER